MFFPFLAYTVNFTYILNMQMMFPAVFFVYPFRDPGRGPSGADRLSHPNASTPLSDHRPVQRAPECFAAQHTREPASRDRQWRSDTGGNRDQLVAPPPLTRLPLFARFNRCIASRLCYCLLPFILCVSV